MYMMSPDVNEVGRRVKSWLCPRMLSADPTVFDTTISKLAFKFEFNWGNWSIPL